MVPVWATVLVGLGAAVIGFLGNALTGWIDLRRSQASNAVTRTNALESTAVAQQVADTERSRSDRDLILQALELIRRPGDATAHRQGTALLDGLSRMPGLSEDDAVLVQSVTRPVLDPVLAQARRLEEATGEAPTFVVAEVTQGPAEAASVRGHGPGDEDKEVDGT
jgi:hypothetical protein